MHIKPYFWGVILATAIVVLCAPTQSIAGKITLVTSSAMAPSTTTPFPHTTNNDETPPPSLLILPDVIFTSGTAQDVIFDVDDSGLGGISTTEYSVITGIKKDYFEAWQGLKLELLEADGSNGLDFDTGGETPSPANYLTFEPDTHNAQTLIWNNAPLPSGSPHTSSLNFALDVPDLNGAEPFSFTLRITPLIPEPTNIALFGLMSLTLLARKRYRRL